MDVTLPRDLEEWVSDAVADGRFGSASDAVAAALRLLIDDDDGPPMPSLEEIEQQLRESDADIAAGRVVSMAEVMADFDEALAAMAARRPGGRN